MKVLHVIDALGVGGGAEHSLAAMLPLLREQGVESSVVCLYRREGGLQATLRDQGFGVDVLPGSSWFGQVRALRRRVRSEHPGIVHATLLRSCLAARIACVGLKVPRLDSLVNTSYDPVRAEQLKIPRWRLELMRRIDGFTARHLVTHFHAITQTVAQEAADRLGVAPERITVVPRGRSAALLGERTAERRREGRSQLDIPMDAPVLLNVGRQDHQKAQASLIRAFARAHERLPDAVLLIAGREGDATSGLEQALANSGLGRTNVRVLGHRTDVPDLCVAADVLVFPSLYEGLGCSLIEAMALSLPIIGSDAPGVAEVLAHGKYGVVVPRADEMALADAIIDLFSDTERRARLACAARNRFLEQYELQMVAHSMVEVYKKLLSNSHVNRKAP